MTKKKKQLRLMGAALVLILLAAVYILVHRAGFNEETEEEVETTDILTVDPTSISAVKLTNSNGTLIFSYDGETWKSEDDPEIALDQDAMTSLFERLNPLSAYRDLGEAADDLAAYGLEEPAITIALALQSGEEVYIYLGDSAADGNLYFMTSDSDHIYTGDSYLVTAFDCEISDLEDTSEDEDETTEAGEETMEAEDETTEAEEETAATEDETTGDEEETIETENEITETGDEASE